MTELQLYKFIQENDIELRWDKDVLAAWIPGLSIDDFGAMTQGCGGEDRIQCVFIPGEITSYLWVNLVPICEYFGINPENISPKTEQ